MQTYDVIIIGGGPAGLTAAIYTSRAFFKTLVLEGSTPGGQLIETTDIENFPGYPNGITGPELIANMRKQAEKFNAEFATENVINVSGDANAGFIIKTTTQEFSAKSVIIATGASAKWLGLESETRLRSKGVSACATCDGFFFRNKVVAVVGGGDAAMEEATFLTKFATKVYVLIRGEKEKMKASKFMQEKASKDSKIEFMFNTQVDEILGDEKVAGLRVANTQTQEKTVLEDVEGVFVAIGHAPNTEFLKGFIDLDEKNYVVVNDQTGTSKEGIFVAGDVADHRYRQAISAAGMGCMASLDAEKFLAHKI